MSRVTETAIMGNQSKPCLKWRSGHTGSENGLPVAQVASTHPDSA